MTHIEVPYTLEHAFIEPERAHTHDAGLDLPAAENDLLNPGSSLLVPTGFAVNIPPGCVGLVCPRSGLAARYGITVLNAPGIVDAGYTGEILVNLHNTSDKLFHIKRGERIAQLVILPTPQVTLRHVDEHARTERGTHGHGSTGN